MLVLLGMINDQSNDGQLEMMLMWEMMVMWAMMAMVEMVMMAVMWEMMVMWNLSDNLSLLPLEQDVLPLLPFFVNFHQMLR